MQDSGNNKLPPRYSVLCPWTSWCRAKPSNTFQKGRPPKWRECPKTPKQQNKAKATDNLKLRELKRTFHQEEYVATLSAAPSDDKDCWMSSPVCVDSAPPSQEAHDLSAYAYDLSMTSQAQCAYVQDICRGLHGLGSGLPDPPPRKEWSPDLQVEGLLITRLLSWFGAGKLICQWCIERHCASTVAEGRLGVGNPRTTALRHLFSGFRLSKHLALSIHQESEMIPYRPLSSV